MVCPRCGADVPEGSRVCPKCFLLVSEFKKYNSENSEKKPITKKWWFWVLIAVVAAAIAVVIFTQVKKDDAAKAAPDASESPAASDDAQTAGDEKTDNLNWQSAGTYCAGKDIDAGVYFVKAEGSGFVSVSTDGTEDGVFGFDNFDTFTFISVEKGQYLTIKNAKFVPADEAPVPQAENGVYSAGVYRVGKDIPAGTYTVTATGDQWGYYDVSGTCTGSLMDIISTNNVQQSEDVAVKDGQYFKVRTATFKAK